MHDFTRLRVWQRAQQLSVEIHRETEGLDERVYPGVGERLRRAVIGISTHIAEGAAQPTPTLFAQALMQSVASATDVLHQLRSARDIGCIHVTRYVMLDTETQEIRRMTYALRGKVIDRINARRSMPSRP